jgi:zinc protease
MNQIKEIETYKNNMPELFFMEEYNRLLYEDHPFFVSGKITEANEEIAKRCAEVAFRDPLEFSVVIVGDFDVEVMKHLVSTYFSFKKIPTNDLRSIELPILPDVKDSVEHVVYKGKETHSTAIMSYRKLCKEKPISDLELSALTHILSERAMKKMRRELGDTYAVYFSYEFPLEPVRESLFVHLRFSCLPEKVQALQTEAEEVILEFLKSGPTEEEVSSAKKIIEQKVKEALLFDDFWKKLQRDEILYKIPASDILRNKKELSLITKENLLALSKEIFENTPVVKISLFPEVK